MKKIASHTPDWSGELIDATTCVDKYRQYIPGIVEKAAYLHGPDDQMPDVVIVNGKRFVPEE